MRFTLLLFAIVFSIGSYAQTDPNEIFRNLKDGAVLVRLKTYDNTIVAIKDHNKRLKDTIAILDQEQDKRRIKKIKKRLEYNNKILYEKTTGRDIENKDLIEAFNQVFNYCPVYFFYSNNAKYVKRKEFEGILLDKNLNIVESTPNLENNYLIAAWYHTMPDTAKYYSHTIKVQGEKSLEDVDIYYSNYVITGIKSLILLTPEFVALQSPYVHYVRTFEGLPFIERTQSRVVELLQFKIEDYVKEHF